MKKRILSLLLALALLLPCLPVTAFAYSGDIPHVDYTRIDYNTVLETEVLFNIGSHTFKGKLANGNMLDEEEVDQIILEFMSSYGITTGDLQRLEALEDTALKFDESRYVHPRVLAEYALVVLGVDNAELLSKLMTGDLKIDPSQFKTPSAAEMIKKLAEGEVLELIQPHARQLFYQVGSAGNLEFGGVDLLLAAQVFGELLGVLHPTDCQEVFCQYSWLNIAALVVF